ncbi:WGxxGxxG family protein [Kamptonema formosum]|uniref:WGxxGxxG family protein n=1 Tax=Kamptonema formosum TaxID=331992 RepID=UPI000349ECFC|nr:WGxxGxxG family protein [Oscillatoria sp. PCC 10802]
MKRSRTSQIVGAGALAASLALLTAVLPASAQTGTTGDTYTTSPRQDVRDTDYSRNNDWGWLGLLGLLGLAGLAGRRSEPARIHQTDPDRTVVR